MKHTLISLLLLLPMIATAEPNGWVIESGLTTKQYVQDHLEEIQQLAADVSHSSSVQFDETMICLNSYSYIEQVGLCQATGSLDQPNTSSTFVITVGEKNPGSGDGLIDVQVKRMVTQLPMR